MRVRVFLLLSVSLVVTAPGAWSWGPDGHRMIGELAVKALPADLPAFLHTPEAAAEAGYLGPEADRERGAGEAFDSDRSPAHFVDVSDDLTILGGPSLKALPPTREAYDTAMRAVGSSQYKAGYLPYSIIEGYELMTKDFAYWRVDMAGEKFAKADAARAWYAHDRVEREKIAIHDLGYWSHFVADGSMPLHASVHYNGWGKFPNPEGFTDAHVHVPWENTYVHDNITEREVEAAMAAVHECACTIAMRTSDYLASDQAEVVSFYRLEKQGAFAKPTPEGKAFTAKRLAAGAAELRDMIVEAWRASDNQTVGYPGVKVSDVEAGKVDPIEELRY
jgi:hypothetical protein